MSVQVNNYATILEHQNKGKPLLQNLNARKPAPVGTLPSPA